MGPFDTSILASLSNLPVFGSSVATSLQRLTSREEHTASGYQRTLRSNWLSPPHARTILIPQIVVGTVIIAWVQGQQRVALIVISIVVMAVAASAAFPYVQQRWIGFLDPVGHALSAGYDYQAITRAVTESQWLGGAASNLPAMSSPTDDYWLAAGCFQVGRLGMILWVCSYRNALLHVEDTTGRRRASFYEQRGDLILSFSSMPGTI